MIRTGLDVELADKRMIPPWFQQSTVDAESGSLQKTSVEHNRTSRIRRCGGCNRTGYRCEMESAIIPLTEGEFDTGTLIGLNRPA